ncbi:MAG: Cell division protein SepF [Candidatus Methanofastidiosum methylothiophilum]|uniref:Cell division protein SepF n=1 Tax=Candidatus Methanofastidiosum methylothiophilum TaxID=1705564 RepID=A0A150J8W8_9EURY|nr:MAG: Cell division protein SepF [Candidatus Methanofastidiosum methylthiophilus]NMC76333.1 cell division protein SepF [Candidatus Methanofastidiosa archaeon]
MRRLNKLFGRDESQDYGNEYDDNYYPDDYYEEGEEDSESWADEERSESPRAIREVESIPYEEEVLKKNDFMDYGVVYIKSLKLRGLGDIRDISKQLSEGHILIVDIGLLAEREPLELKRAIDQIKGILRGIGGDIAGISDRKILIAPSSVKIVRSHEQ